MMLQTAQLQKAIGEDWHIVTPSDEALGTLPKELSNKDVIGIMEFAQGYEQKAYHEGTAAGRESLAYVVTQRVDELMNHIRGLEAHNAVLAQKLESLISKDA